MIITESNDERRSHEGSQHFAISNTPDQRIRQRFN